MRWQDIDIKAALWTLPRESTKADRLHEVPLTPLSLKVLKEVKRTGDKYVFTTNGKTPISGFSRAKARLEAVVVNQRLKSAGKSKPTEKELAKAAIPDWRLHDLRRTMASNMAKLGVEPHVIEKVLNHSSGAISGVAAVYNRYAYTDEKRAALDTWSETLTGIVNDG